MKLNRMFIRAASIGMIGSLFMAVPAYAADGQDGVAGVEDFFRGNTAEGQHLVGVAAVSFENEAYYNVMRAKMAVNYKDQMTQEQIDAQVKLARTIDQNASGIRKASPYDNIAISQVENYVNVRNAASENGEVLGKIYSNAAATILETIYTENEGIWYHIKSGSVDGYIKADYFAIGDQAQQLAFELGEVHATVNTDALRLRAEASTDSDLVTLLSGEEKYSVVALDGDFTQLKVGDELSGYVASEYVDLSVEFPQAISLEEERAAEEAKRRAEEEERRRQEEERKKAEEAERQKAEAAANSKKETVKKETAKQETSKQETAKQETAKKPASSTTKTENTSSADRDDDDDYVAVDDDDEVIVEEEPEEDEEPVVDNDDSEEAAPEENIRIEEEEEEEEKGGKWVSLGTFKTTAYCTCSKCNGSNAGKTATGATPKVGVTIAVDKSVIPLGSRIKIGGHEYIAQDTGVKGNTIDILMSSHDTCMDYGVVYKEVYIYRD